MRLRFEPVQLSAKIKKNTQNDWSLAFGKREIQIKISKCLILYLFVNGFKEFLEASLYRSLEFTLTNIDKLN